MQVQQKTLSLEFPILTPLGPEIKDDKKMVQFRQLQNMPEAVFRKMLRGRAGRRSI